MMPSASMMEMLQGMQFPMRKEQIIQQFTKQNAPNDIIENLRMLPGREYESADSLMKALESASQMAGGGGGGKSQSFGGTGSGGTGESGGGGPSSGGSSQGFGGRGGT